MATLAQARLAACDKRKYATYQILSLVPVPKPGIGTMAVDDHWRLYYDPNFLDGVTIPQAVGVILRESAHLLFGHSQRAKMLGITADSALDWNIATNASINDILRAEGVELPPDSVFPDKLGFPAGKAAETYYDLIRRKRQDEEQAAQQAQEQAQQGQDGDESEQGDSDSQTDKDASDEQPDAGNGQDENQGDGDESDAQDTGDQDDDADEQGQPGESAGRDDSGDPESDGEGESTPGGDAHGDSGDEGELRGGEGQGGEDSEDGGESAAGVGTGGQPSDASDDGESGNDASDGGQIARYPGEGGSCSDGIRRPWEDDPPADDDGDEQDGDTAPRGVPKWEQDLIREQVAKAAEKFKGNMPGGMLGEIDKILNPRVDPRRLLMRAVRANTDNACRSGGGRFTYRRPSRRPSFGGTVRPSSFQPIPRIVVLVDTSGSMDSEDLGLALGLVGNVLNGLRLRDGVQVVCADAAIQWAGKVFDPSKIVIAGRGGTEMGKMMEAVVRDAKRGEKPELVICVTDAATDWPRKKLDVPCVACVTRGSRNSFYVKRIPAWIETVILKETE